MSIADQLTIGRPLPATRRNATLGGFKSAIRVQQSFLARVEKRVLLWMAERTPLWINSDHLTAMGSAGILMAGVCYGLARWHAWALLGATLCLGVNWLGDSLDGTLARVRNRQRPRYGFYIDHVLDTFGAFFLMRAGTLRLHASDDRERDAGGIFDALDRGVPGNLHDWQFPPLVLEVRAD